MKVIKILSKNNIAHGMLINGIETKIDSKLPSNFNEINKCDKFEILKIECNKNNTVDFIEFSRIGDYVLEYNDFIFSEKALKNEIKQLLKYSHCLVDSCTTYYFPVIKLILWTNISENQPGYTYGIYKYGYYDSFNDKKINDIINNVTKYEKGIRIDI